MKTIVNHFRLSVVIPISAFLITVIIFRFVFVLGVVPSKSMEPTISGDNTFILGFRLDRDYSVGDVVVFRHEGRLLVKRIAYQSGDALVHNSVPVTVPDNTFYMLGDNSEYSVDSRYWDQPYVPESDVIAKVILPDCGKQPPQ